MPWRERSLRNREKVRIPPAIFKGMRVQWKCSCGWENDSPSAYIHATGGGCNCRANEQYCYCAGPTARITVKCGDIQGGCGDNHDFTF